jgi:hypothetical protein
MSNRPAVLTLLRSAILGITLVCSPLCATGDPAIFAEGYVQSFDRYARVPPRPVLNEARTQIGYAFAGRGAVPRSDAEDVRWMEREIWGGLTRRCCGSNVFSGCLEHLAARDQTLASDLASTPGEPHPLYLGSAAGLLARLAALSGEACACVHEPEEMLVSCRY